MLPKDEAMIAPLQAPSTQEGFNPPSGSLYRQVPHAAHLPFWDPKSPQIAKNNMFWAPKKTLQS